MACHVAIHDSTQSRNSPGSFPQTPAGFPGGGRFHWASAGPPVFRFLWPSRQWHDEAVSSQLFLLINIAHLHPSPSFRKPRRYTTNSGSRGGDDNSATREGRLLCAALQLFGSDTRSLRGPLESNLIGRALIAKSYRFCNFRVGADAPHYSGPSVTVFG